MERREETSRLRAQLAGQRRHVLGILEGLADEPLRRPVLPSGWSCLGMVRHLAFTERYWFRCVVGGEPFALLPPAGAEWQVDPEETAETVLAQYREEIDRCDAVIAATGLDQPPRQPDPVWVEWRTDFPDLRSILLHMVVETATHAGHLDTVRELIDGRQWLVLD